MAALVTFRTEFVQLHIAVNTRVANVRADDLALLDQAPILFVPSATVSVSITYKIKILQQQIERSSDAADGHNSGSE